MPLLAVASELRKRNPQIKLVYIGERHGKFAYIAKDSGLFDELRYISAGKLRRYHGESLLTRLFDIKTNILNIRDLFRLCAGLVQGYFLLRTIKPDAMLLKGGFVCVPIATAGRLRHVPYVTHDSDALPGLSNRLAARWARYHATAMPAKYYSYPEETVKPVGVPTDDRYKQYNATELSNFRKKHRIPVGSDVLLVTGGSNGARRLNEAFISLVPDLLKRHPKLYILHQIGAGNEDQVVGLTEDQRKRFCAFGFSQELFELSAIADVVIARAGASALADLGAQRKACIVVPNPYLAGGHQLKNAQVYQESNAAIIVGENELQADAKPLFGAIERLLNDRSLRQQLGESMHRLQPKYPAASALADILENLAA